MSCAFAPVNNNYEKAGTLKKGTVEFLGNYTGYSYTSSYESGTANNNFGFRAGLGISDKFDLKIRYEKLIPSNTFDSEEFDESSNINYYSIVPKFAIVPEKLALLVPVSLYTVKEEFEGYTNNSSFFSIAPQGIYTYTNTKKTVDLSFGLKSDLWFTGDGGFFIIETTAGAGFSSDLNKWAIRPELGAAFQGGAVYLSYGVGVQYLIPKKTK